MLYRFFSQMNLYAIGLRLVDLPSPLGIGMTNARKIILKLSLELLSFPNLTKLSFFYSFFVHYRTLSSQKQLYTWRKALIFLLF
jgi:hypothetical protein